MFVTVAELSMGDRSTKTGRISTMASALVVTKIGTSRWIGSFRGSTSLTEALTSNFSGSCPAASLPAMTCSVTAPSPSVRALAKESRAPPESGVSSSSMMEKDMTIPGTASPCRPSRWNTSNRLPKGGMATVSEVA
jgi:hypothetical protein